MERPTWANYAIGNNAERPHLWSGCVFAVAPCLGPTGSQLFDVVDGRRGTLTSMDNATDWIVSDGQYCLDLDGTDDTVTFGAFGIGIDNGTVAAWVYNRSSV